MNQCENCLKENDCKESDFSSSGCCGGYSPVRVTNKERLAIKTYEEAALMLSDLFRKVDDSGKAGADILEWLKSW